MFKVGIIGAGNISRAHLISYNRNPEVEVVAIADLNEALVKERTEAFGVKKYYTDYKDLLKDETIEAVSILTPLFTHHQIVIEALNAGKHVLCEKPPCMTPQQVQECVDTAKSANKLLMWALVCRFRKEMKYLKEHVDAGHLGEIYHAEAVGVERCSMMRGWFVDKERAGGGFLLDGAIHRIDEALYLMGYPKVKMVVGFTTNVNHDLPKKIKGVGVGWASCDTNEYERTVESAASGYVRFENGACLYVKGAGIMYNTRAEGYINLCGDHGGARLEGGNIELIENVDNYLMESKPIITADINMFDQEINHFVDCCRNGKECIVPGWQGVELMKVINGIYRSAESGQPVYY